MDARAQRRFGDRHRGRLFQIARELGGQDGRLAGPAQHGQALVAQKAERSLRREHRLLRRIAALRGQRIVIGARAQEHEPLRGQPAQESGVFLRVIGPEGCARGGQFLARGKGQIAQRLDVGDSDVDVVQGAPDFLQQRAAAVLADRRQQHQDKGLCGDALTWVGAKVHHGVEHGPDLVAPGRQRRHDAVNQEGPVGLGDLEHIEMEISSLGGQGARQLDAGRRQKTERGEAPETGEDGGEVFQTDAAQLIGHDVLGRLLHEAHLTIAEHVEFERRGESLPKSSLRGGVDLVVVHSSATFHPCRTQDGPQFGLDQPEARNALDGAHGYVTSILY